MARHMTYVDCCTDPNIFGPWFSGDSWNTWRVVDKAIFGLPMTAERAGRLHVDHRAHRGAHERPARRPG